MRKTQSRFPIRTATGWPTRSEVGLLLAGIAVIVATLLLATGCQGTRETRVEWVTTQWIDGRPVTAVRLSESVTQKVYYRNAAGSWELSVNKIEISPGWYVVAPPPPDQEK